MKLFFLRNAGPRKTLISSYCEDNVNIEYTIRVTEEGRVSEAF